MSFADMSIDDGNDEDPLVSGFSGFSLSDQQMRHRQQQPPFFDDLTSEFSNLRTNELPDPDVMDIDDPTDMLDLQAANLGENAHISTPVKTKRKTSFSSSGATSSPWKISSVFNPTGLGAQFAVKEIEKNEDVDMSMVLYSPVKEPQQNAATTATTDDMGSPVRTPKIPDDVFTDKPISMGLGPLKSTPVSASSEPQPSGSLGMAHPQNGAEYSTPSQEYHLHLPKPTLGWMLQNPNLPYIITSYLQLAFNGIMLALLAYVVYLFISSVRQDVGFKYDAHSGEILMAKSKCAKLYLQNNCVAHLRPPALESACDAWELCMNRDHEAVNRARLGAETLAEVISGFIDRFSYKALGLVAVLFLGSMFVSNFAFGFFRAKTYYQGEVEKQKGIWDKARDAWKGGPRIKEEPKKLVLGQRDVFK